MTSLPFSRILVAWLAAGVVRVALGSSTSVIAYLFFGVFWLVSAILFVVAIRMLVVSTETEQRVEAGSVCAGLLALFAQGLFGNGGTAAVAALVFLAAAILLAVIYVRRLVRKRHVVG